MPQIRSVSWFLLLQMMIGTEMAGPGYATADLYLHLAPDVPWIDDGLRLHAEAEQRRRFEARNAEPLKRWKLSEMDLAEHELYVRYSMAKDTTFQYTDIKQAPWYVVPSDDKRAARLNCISHLLSLFPYEDVAPEPVTLPEMRDLHYMRPPMHEQTFVPQLF